MRSKAFIVSKDMTLLFLMFQRDIGESFIPEWIYHIAEIPRFPHLLIDARLPQ